MRNETELTLSFWRDGQTNAERLAAALLRLSGYEQIDPQSPLGGPDGKKDIICIKGGIRWVVGVHFPTKPLSFGQTKKKFAADLAGAAQHEAAAGFVFVTNQTLTPTQRQSLAALAIGQKKEADILHLQQMQTLLDQPAGYGVRIQYLGIAMSIEDQLSWAVDSDTQTAKAIQANTRELLALRGVIERLNVGQAHLIKTFNASGLGSAPTPDLISTSSFAKADGFLALSASLTPSLILLIHRLTCFDLPSRAVGAFRTDDVWLANLDGQPIQHLRPPAAREIAVTIEKLCDQWRLEFPKLRTAERKLLAIAEFHQRFLALHPFWDGNGRVARTITMQQCLDLFGAANMTLMNKGAAYYEALKAADAGDFQKLADVFAPVAES